MTSYRQAATVLWGDAGGFAHDTYTRHRHLYPELPEQLPIVIGITAYGRCLGLTRGDWDHGPRITIGSNVFKIGRNHVTDIMIHEMLHVWLNITGQPTKHQSDAWYAAVRQLSPAVLGHEIDARRGADRKSVRVPNPTAFDEGQPATLVRKVTVPDAIPHDQVSRWPYSFRPADHDPGEPIDCPSY